MSSSFSTSRQLFSQQLSQLVQQIDSNNDIDQEGGIKVKVTEIVEQSFGGNGKETQQPWRNDTRRVIIEKALDELVQQATTTSSSDSQREEEGKQKLLESRLDLLLNFVELGYVDENLPLQTLASLFELRPISLCEPLIEYLETRVERLTFKMEYQRGRGPILLRLLNDLLRRLPRSQTQPVILSGRILMLLSSVYPLGEKSGVNLRGNFNIGKGTVWEQDQPQKKLINNNKEEGVKMEVEEGEEEDQSTDSFYSTFWSLQKYFNNPHLLFSSTSSPPPLTTLYSSLLKVLDAFSIETKKERELSGSSSSSSSSTPSSMSSSAEQQQQPSNDDSSASSSSSSSLSQYFFPKFLTSQNLLSLELSDQSFRLQLLIQILILTQYLKSLTPESRSRVQFLPLTNTSAFPSYVLNKEEEVKIDEIEEKTWKEISKMQQQGGSGTRVKKSIQEILKRERNWTDWKLKSCLPFTKPPLEGLDHQVSKTVQTKLNNMTRPPPKFPYKLGNARLSRVWMKDLKTLEGFEPAQDTTDDSFDSIVREYRMTKKRLEMTKTQLKSIGPSTNTKSSELQSSIEPMNIKLQALHFRALRTASTQYLRHFNQIGSGDLDKLLQVIETERRKKLEAEEEREEQAAAAAATTLSSEQQLGQEQQRAVVGKDKSEKTDVVGGKFENEEKKAAIKLGDTPIRDDDDPEEDDHDEKGKKGNESGITTASTPKRPRSDSPAEEDTTKSDTLMKDVTSSKKQKI